MFKVVEALSAYYFFKEERRRKKTLKQRCKVS
jgi:hypothetical protein